MQKLLALISIILELPEDHLSKGHQYNDVSGCHLRYMIYRHRTAEENAEYQNLYSKGHTDFGSLTLLFRQPVAALQIRMHDGSWKWVKPYPGSIVSRMTHNVCCDPETDNRFRRSILQTCLTSGRLGTSRAVSTEWSHHRQTKLTSIDLAYCTSYAQQSISSSKHSIAHC